jgi:hypothetical protein
MQTNLGSSKAARRDARELLAEYQRFVWAKGAETGWIDLQVYLGRLHGRLREAGVPVEAINDFRDAAIDFWKGIREGDADGETIWYLTDNRLGVALDAASDILTDYLDESWWRRRRADRRRRRSRS